MPITGETLESQVKRLADFIMNEIPGEPSKNLGAIDTAINIIKKQRMDIKMWPKVNKDFLTEWRNIIYEFIEYGKRFVTYEQMIKSLLEEAGVQVIIEKGEK